MSSFQPITGESWSVGVQLPRVPSPSGWVTLTHVFDTGSIYVLYLHGQKSKGVSESVYIVEY